MDSVELYRQLLGLTAPWTVEQVELDMAMQRVDVHVEHPTHSRLAPMIAAAKLIARHWPNVLTYFTHRITNAVAEGLNSKIATVQKRACGYRNPEHFKIAVYFHCGGLNLYPTAMTHTKVG